MITIDGSQGEGGGQILRTALALSLVTGQAFTIHRIRAGRRKPGLLRQHLTAVEAATRLCQATADGAAIGSTSLTFRPGKVVSGDYAFAVGTAGSATLVFQTVLPALMLAEKSSSLVLEGGTHNPSAPPFDFLAKAFLPLVNRLGPTVTATLDQPGFYPAGGGRFHVNLQPTPRLQPMELLERGPIVSKTGRVLLAHLPQSIGLRQAQLLRQQLNWPEDTIEVLSLANSAGPGNAVVLEVHSERLIEVFTGFGARDVPSAKVVDAAVDQVREYLASQAPIGEYLADQLMLPFALAGEGAYLATKATRHASTQADILQRFLETRIRLIPQESGNVLFRFGS
jgi:RNA 3'-terminal phosphate cyclase (ATP)